MEEHNGTCLHSLPEMGDNEGSSLAASFSFIHLHNTPHFLFLTLKCFFPDHTPQYQHVVYTP